MLLTGTFARTLDEKLRVALPKQLRKGEGQTCVYLAPGLDGSLAVYTEEALARLADRLGQASPVQQEVRAFQRLFYARAQRVESDAQGRLRIPAELAALAQLSKEVVLLGVQDHVEIWAAERWQQYQAERQGHFDQIAEQAFGQLS